MHTLVLVEALERADADELTVASRAEERDGGLEQAVEIQRVHVVGRRDLAYFGRCERIRPFDRSPRRCMRPPTPSRTRYARSGCRTTPARGAARSIATERANAGC